MQQLIRGVNDDAEGLDAENVVMVHPLKASQRIDYRKR